jgi:hypothetical protein
MYSCKNGCGYESTHRGGMNLHEKIHCKQKPVGADRQQEHKEKCSHQWRLLNNPEIRLLAGNGVNDYEEVCSKCQELR